MGEGMPCGLWRVVDEDEDEGGRVVGDGDGEVEGRMEGRGGVA